jgi:hypothetical protein
MTDDRVEVLERQVTELATALAELQNTVEHIRLYGPYRTADDD